MAFFQLVLNARRLDETRKRYHDEKLRSIELSQKGTAHLTFFQKVRRLKYRLVHNLVTLFFVYTIKNIYALNFLFHRLIHFDLSNEWLIFPGLKRNCQIFLVTYYRVTYGFTTNMFCSKLMELWKITYSRAFLALSEGYFSHSFSSSFSHFNYTSTWQ